MNHFFRWITIATLAFAAAAISAAPRDAVEVRLSAPRPVLYGDVDVVVTVTVSNTTRHPVQLLRWQLPSDELEGALFRITRDGEAVPYTGPLIKRTPPQPADRVRLDAGTSLSYDVELTGAYDLSRSGRYDIEYLSRSAHGTGATTLHSDTLHLWLEGRSVQAKPVPPPPAPPPGGSISYSGNCSASQQSALQLAVTGATGYATTSTTYLNATPAGTARYVTWFGAYAAAGWSTAQGHFTKIRDAFTAQPLTLDCKCKKPQYYAYVYANQPYKIYLCGAFWSAPATGTDSRAGTLIHEMSHFTVVAGTDDWAYSQTAAQALAISDPAKALDNADSHEYFAENNPALP